MTDSDFRPQQFVMAFEQAIREANREILGSLLGTITTDNFVTLMVAVAKARGAYLYEASTIAGKGDVPDTEAVERLKELRTTYEELVTAAQGLEHAIERGYLDVGP